MKLNFGYQFIDADDQPILENNEPVQLVTLLKRAVLADVNPDGSAIKPDDKYNRYELYMKLRSADANTEFSASEVALLDSAVRVFPTLVTGQLLRLLKV